MVEMGGKKKGSVSRRASKYVIPAPERYFYASMTVGAVFYICYCVYRDSIRYDGILNMYDFEQGWPLLGREKDISNFEWHFWYGMFWTLWPWYLAHVVLSRVVDQNAKQLKAVAFLSLSLVSICKIMGWKPVLLILGHCVVIYLSTFMGSCVGVWSVSLALLTTINVEVSVTLMKTLVEQDEEESLFYLMVFTVALANIRCTSFCVEKCWGQRDLADHRQTNKQIYKQQDSKVEHELGQKILSQDEALRKTQTDDVKKKTAERDKRGEGENVANDTNTTMSLNFSFMDLLVYIFYLPLFFTGPILTYNSFQKQFNSLVVPLPWTRVISHGLFTIRMIFWAFFNEFIVHCFYFSALQHNETVIKSVSLWTLAGIGYCQGQFFMNKYVVMFGFPAGFARIDGFDPPPGPRCISYIYLYSDMWKYFDQGLYSFLKRYIYIPIGGSHAGRLRQFLGSVMCFLYIFYWHGAEHYIFLWTILNFLGVFLEVLGGIISELPVVKQFETEKLSPATVQRIHALLAVPVFLISCFSIFCFFGGRAVGYIFFERLIIKGWLTTWITLTFFLYCAIMNAMEINKWQETHTNK
ncbi:hypothetical protein CHS0354_013790 [Potamilus streckersoni]|uniref:Protein-cysteine N-palmitoyltransferase Rasp n=1 Tax=Potamilus streckersoni TaxID=2493646 RepID=A0AAE0SGH5_9BIVA|nr:hypothetical protein CHS0354_013790 [Potamilus streckersoni]